MPRKRKRGRSPSKQKTQEIRTRLIEISLKVEDLIYQKKPISLLQAESYTKEVMSYKLRCSDDKRSLQVIEKLVRCMKAIIIEHEESEFNDRKINYEAGGSKSPVYSLPDEDRTQLSQQLEDAFLVNNANQKNNQIAITHNNILSETEFVNVTANHETENAIINLCSDNEDLIEANNYTENTSCIHVDIQKALSNLSLHNENREPTPPMDIEYSQSILSYFCDTENLGQNSNSNLNAGTYKDLIENVGPEQNNVKKPADTTIKSNFKSTKLELIDNAPKTTIISNSVEILPDKMSQQNNKANKIDTDIEYSQSILNSFHEDKLQPTKTVDLKPSRYVFIGHDTKTIASNVQKITKPATETLLPNYAMTITAYKNITQNLQNLHSRNTIASNKEVKAVGNITDNFNDTLINSKANYKVNVATTHNYVQRQLGNPTYTINKEKQKYIHPIHNDRISSTINALTFNSYELNHPANSNQYKDQASKNTPITAKKKRARKKKSVADVKIDNSVSNCLNKKFDLPKTRKPRTKKIDADKVISKTAVIPPIYYKCLENDLSWIENIRFVREVKDNENDSGLANLSEHFWDNYDLPTNFDDGDFL